MLKNIFINLFDALCREVEGGGIPFLKKLHLILKRGDYKMAELTSPRSNGENKNDMLKKKAR